MNDNKDLEKAINELKNTAAPDGPSKELIEQTLRKISSEQENTTTTTKTNRFISIFRIAAAAVILIAAGYGFGQLVSPAKLDAEQFQALEASVKASLRPLVRQQLQQDIIKQMQAVADERYSKLKNELQEQFNADLNKFALDLTNASGAITEQLFLDLIDAINTAQARERAMFVAALEQLELNQLARDSQIQDGIVQFAVQAENELSTTKDSVARLLAHAQLDNPFLKNNETNNNEKEN
jgi:hypothetical protein